jgi:hypothetical protein
MFGMWRTREFHDPQLGPLKRIFRNVWGTPPVDGVIGVTVYGTREEPDSHALEIARQLLRDPQPLIEPARQFVLHDRHALEFMQAGGELLCDGFSVRESGDFSVEFSLADWPDAMITVRFEQGVPCEVLLGD